MKYYRFLFRLKYVFFIHFCCDGLFCSYRQNENKQYYRTNSPVYQHEYQDKPIRQDRHFNQHQQPQPIRQDRHVNQQPQIIQRQYIIPPLKKKQPFNTSCQTNNIFYSLKIITILLYFIQWHPYIKNLAIKQLKIWGIKFIYLYWASLVILNFLIFVQFSFYRKFFIMEILIGIVYLIKLMKPGHELIKNFLQNNQIIYILLVVYLTLLNGLYLYQNTSFTFFYQWFFIQIAITSLLLPVLEEYQIELINNSNKKGGEYAPKIMTNETQIQIKNDWIFVISFILTKFLFLNYINLSLKQFLLKNFLKFFFIIMFGLVYFSVEYFDHVKKLFPDDEKEDKDNKPLSLRKKIIFFNIFFILNNILDYNRNLFKSIFYYFTVDFLIYYYFCQSYFNSSVYEPRKNDVYEDLHPDQTNPWVKTINKIFEIIEKYSFIKIIEDKKKNQWINIFHNTLNILKDLLKIISDGLNNPVLKQISSLFEQKEADDSHSKQKQPQQQQQQPQQPQHPFVQYIQKAHQAYESLFKEDDKKYIKNDIIIYLIYASSLY